MLTVLRNRFYAFLSARGGVTAIEFAFISPIMIMMTFGCIDLARYAIATEKVSKVASTIAQMITVNDSSPTGNNAVGAVTYVDLQFYHDSAMVIFPDVLADAAKEGVPWTQDISISMASVNFTTTQTNCGSTCTYTPKVIWTGGNNPRPCTPAPTPVSDTSIPSSSTLPTDLWGPGSVIVVDVNYTFHPFFSSYIPLAIPIVRSTFLAPRYKSQITYQVISGDNGIAKNCP
jgi:Flp pilus assembly protein TadG